ncbi:MAG: NPCBM/NEW2 domain-containing protein [Candidatus Gottesmanbacteria bacterium]
MISILNKRWLLPFLFLTAFLLRMAFVPNPGFEADMSFWKSWGLAPFDHGIVKGLSLTNNNYPTPFGYLLWFVTAIYSLFQNPHIYNEFWSNTNLLFLTLMKFPSIIADLGIGAVIIWFSRRIFQKNNDAQKTGNLLGIILASLYLFNPVSILDSAVWGQVDALGVCLFLIALVLCFKDKPFLAGLLYMTALMTKLQNMIYGPLFFLLVWQITGLPGLIKAIAGSTLAFFGLNVEFLIAKQMNRVIDALTVNYDYFPYLSLNAYNLWWIVAKGFGMQVSDKILTIGIINAKITGLLLFSSFYLLATGNMIFKNYNQVDDNKKTSVITTFFTALIIAASAFFLFQTESHDRYAFPIIVFLLFWIPLFIKQHITIKERIDFWNTTVFKYSIIGYILFSLLYFLNMHTALIVNYPKNGLTFLSFINQPFFTITLSYILLTCFVVFLIINLKEPSKRIVILSLCCFFGYILLINLPFIQKKALSLTKLTPITHSQQYGQLSTNMPVNAKKSDSKTWDRLSVQYMFYTQGLGAHANSTIIYNLAKRFSRFSTDMGIDTEAGSQASVVFAIYGDDMLLFQSPIMKRYDYPKHTEVDISGVSKLKLVVADAGNGNIDDHADWLNPTLWP